MAEAHCSSGSSAAAQLLQLSSSSSSAVTAQLHQQCSMLQQYSSDSLAALQPCSSNQQPCSLAAMQPCSHAALQPAAVQLCSLAASSLAASSHAAMQPCSLAAITYSPAAPNQQPCRFAVLQLYSLAAAMTSHAAIINNLAALRPQATALKPCMNIPNE